MDRTVRSLITLSLVAITFVGCGVARQHVTFANALPSDSDERIRSVRLVDGTSIVFADDGATVTHGTPTMVSGVVEGGRLMSIEANRIARAEVEAKDFNWPFWWTLTGAIVALTTAAGAAAGASN